MSLGEMLKTQKTGNPIYMKKKKYLVGKLGEKEKTTDPSFKEEKRETKCQRLIQLNADRRRIHLEFAKLKGDIPHSKWQTQFSLKLWSRFQS